LNVVAAVVAVVVAVAAVVVAAILMWPHNSVPFPPPTFAHRLASVF